MMIRKPTKIELKPEDDFYEYEEYKQKQMEQAAAANKLKNSADLKEFQNMKSP